MKANGLILEVKGVDKVYTGTVDTQVLFDINLDFEAGSFNSIVGQSGSGKTTLLNIIGTLDRPTRGEVIIAGQTTSNLSKDEMAVLRNETIGFVFQFHYLLPEFTAMENVLIPHLIKYRRPGPDITKRAEELLEMAGIAQVKNNLARRMSGGQQQRVAIVRALINSPRIFLADEPTGNVDSETTETLYRIFRDVNRKLGTTFIIVTHNRAIAEQTDRIVEIKDGRIEMDIRK